MTNQNCESNPRRCGDCRLFGKIRGANGDWCPYHSSDPGRKRNDCYSNPYTMKRARCQEPDRSCDV